VLLTIDASDARPVFRQIVDEVQRCVAVGVLKPADALPAVRALAADLKVNANTVQHAYRTLEQEGTVIVRRGLGTFVAAPRTRDSRARQQAVARQIAEKMLREGYRHGLLASDLVTALQEIAPRRGDAGGSGSGGQEEV
jgi:DNA-binding transcriptional regulator YhcF (GntR family)